MGTIRNKHLETTNKCCTTDVDGIIRQCTLVDKSDDCNHYKPESCALYLCGKIHKICFLMKLNHLVPKDVKNQCGSVMPKKWNDQHFCGPLTCKGMGH